MKSYLSKFYNDVRGATAIEYALIAGLIAIAVIGGATALGGQINTKFNAIVTALQ